MGCIIVYVSKHKGNTKKIALAMADEVKCAAKSLEEVSVEELEKYDLVGIGSGIYAFGMDRSLKRLLKNIKNPNGKKVFIFSTSADLNGSRYHKGMKKFLQKKGFRLVGEFNCPGAYTGWFFGKKSLNLDRPNESDLKSAKDFAKSIVEKFI